MWFWVLIGWVVVSFPAAVVIGAVIHRHPPQPIEAVPARLGEVGAAHRAVA